ncbi:MAG: hypothetical protein V1755_03440 [Chloroflexota bacterium]
MRRSSLRLILFAAGGLAALAAALAGTLGLDRSPGWGRARLVLLMAGVVMCSIAALSHYSAKLIDGSPGWLHRRSRLWAIFGAARSAAGPQFLGLVLGGLVSVGIAVYVLWYTSAGRFPDFPHVHNDYADLGDALLHGQLSLLETPSPELQVLQDPYDPSQRVNVPYRWDASYYDGRYYLYWGPVPAIVSAGLQVLIGAPPSGALLVALAFLGLLAVFLGYLKRIWGRLYAGRPMFSLGLFAAVAFVNLPLLFEVGQARVYDASVLYGQLFLLAGLLGWELYAGTAKPAWLVAAGLGWGLAIGCRYNLLLSVIVFAASVMIWLVRRGPQRLAWQRVGLLAAPILACLIALGLYNYVRFGSVLETGMAYQLSFGASQHLSYSPAHIPSSLYIYFFYPLTTAGTFPFIRSALFDPVLVPSWLQMSADRVFDHVIFGTLPAVPGLWLLVLAPPLLLLEVRSARRPADARAGDFEQNFTFWMITAAAAGQILYLSVFFYAAERYVGDFFLLTVLAMAMVVARFDVYLSSHWMRVALWGVATALAVWTVAIGYFGAFSVPPKTLSAANPSLYSALAAGWNDRISDMHALLERINDVVGR